MRPLRVVALYFVIVLLGGALLAPWLYFLVQAMSGVMPALEDLASKPFSRYVSRALLIFALLGLWPFLRSLGLRSWREVGLGSRPDAWSQIGRGFLAGLVSLAVLVFIILLCGARLPKQGHSVSAILVHLLNAGSSAVVVALVEEVFFRGALFGALRKSLHWIAALVASSVIYALLHFLEKPGPFAEVHWSSGLTVLVGMLAGFADWQKFVPGFFNLALAGVILGVAYQRSGSIHFSIGLHAGWIFWLKAYGFFTQPAHDSYVWLFGTGKLINGWLAFLVLTAMALLLDRLFPRRTRPEPWKATQLCRP